jgi:hypothetical protein
MAEPLQLNVGDVVQMRKGHPCGGDTWRIVRVGADIGIRCLTCDRKVLLPRAECERRIKRFVSRAEPDAAATSTNDDAASGG